MAVDLSKLSLALIKAELGRKGLDTTGKKHELVQRLKDAIDEADGEEVEEDEEEVEAMEVKEEVPDKQPRRWLHILAGPRLASSKFRHLEVVQNMTIKRRQKDNQDGTQEHRVRVFPLDIADLDHPTIALLMRQSSKSVATILPIVSHGEDTGERKLILQLNFAKGSDALASLQVLKGFREGLNVHHPSLKKELKQYYDEWRLLHRGTVEHSDNFLILVPQVPTEIDEEMLWQFFSNASEIHMFPGANKNVRFGGQREDRMQPPYAYVQYANVEALKTNIDRLNTVEPTEAMKKMCIVPYQSMPDWVGKDVLTNKKSEQLQEVKPAAEFKFARPRKNLGRGSTLKGVQHTTFKDRSRQNQLPYNQQRPSSGFQQRRGPGSAPSTSGYMAQQHRTPNVRGPPKNPAIQAFGRMMSDMQADNASIDFLTQLLQSEQGSLLKSHLAQPQSVNPSYEAPVSREPARNHGQWRDSPSSVGQNYNQPTGRQQTHASSSYQDRYVDSGDRYKQKFSDAFGKYGY